MKDKLPFGTEFYHCGERCVISCYDAFNEKYYAKCEFPHGLEYRWFAEIYVKQCIAMEKIK